MRAFPLITLVVLAAPSILAATPEPLQLPKPLVNAAAASDGHHVYVFGGFFRGPMGREASADVLRFDPQSGRTEKVAELPSPRMGAAAVWTGREMLIVGGLNESGPLDEIVAFEPRSSKIHLAGARLPEPLSNVAAAWNGTRLLLLGGIGACLDECPNFSTAIASYDPSRDRLDLLAARLPHGLASSAIHDGESVYLLGGLTPSAGGSSSDLILRYRPGSTAVEVLPQRLPRPLSGVGVAWENGTAFVLGGEPELQRPTRDIFAFKPSEGTIFMLDKPLPEARAAFATATVDGRAYALGGLGCAGPSYCDTILPVDLRSPLLHPVPENALGRASTDDGRDTPAPPVAVLLVSVSLAALLRRLPASSGGRRALRPMGRAFPSKTLTSPARISLSLHYRGRRKNV